MTFFNKVVRWKAANAAWLILLTSEIPKLVGIVASIWAIILGFLWHGVTNAFGVADERLHLIFHKCYQLNTFQNWALEWNWLTLNASKSTWTHIAFSLLSCLLFSGIICYSSLCQGFPQMQCMLFIHASCMAAAGMHICCTRQESVPTFGLPCHLNAVEKGNTSTPLIPYGWHHSSNGMGKVQMKCRNEEPSGTWILGLEREWTCTFYAIAVSAVMGLFASVNALSKPSILTSICTAGFILPWMNAG